MNSSVAIRHDLVLVGGGHTHVQVLRSWAMDPPPGVRVTVVVDRPVAVYSGMVPGFVAGQYRQGELEIDVRPLCMRAGARFIVAAATGLDPSQRRVILEGRPPLAYDTISFDVGSTIAGLDRPGVAEHAIPTRPIGAFVRSADAVVERARGRPGVKLVVVGAGAGGVELAFAFRARFEREGIRGASVALLEAGPTVLPGYPAAAVRGIEHNARAPGTDAHRQPPRARQGGLDASLPAPAGFPVAAQSGRRPGAGLQVGNRARGQLGLHPQGLDRSPLRAAL